MRKILSAEFYKTRRSGLRRLPIVFPLITCALAFVLTLGMPDSFAESVWNWWYTLLLPILLALLCHLSVAQEKRTNGYHLLTLPTAKRRLLLGKLLMLCLSMLGANVILFVCASLGGLLLSTRVPFGGAAAAVLLLTFTELWELPLFLYLSDRFGMIAELLVCLFLTVGGTILSQTALWYVLPSALPMRVMCPLLHILPNGLHAEAGHPFLAAYNLLPALCISALWCIALTSLGLIHFEKREAC